MNCSYQPPEGDKKVFCRSAYHRRVYAENRDQILAQRKRYRTENAKILKTRRNRWYENNKKRIVKCQRAHVQKNKEYVSNNYQRQCWENNRARLYEYWKGYYAKNKEWIRRRLREQRQKNRKEWNVQLHFVKYQQNSCIKKSRFFSTLCVILDFFERFVLFHPQRHSNFLFCNWTSSLRTACVPLNCRHAVRFFLSTRGVSYQNPSSWRRLI